VGARGIRSAGLRGNGVEQTEEGEARAAAMRSCRRLRWSIRRLGRAGRAAFARVARR
jgi:hypothetical protein